MPLLPGQEPVKWSQGKVRIKAPLSNIMPLLPGKELVSWTQGSGQEFFPTSSNPMPLLSGQEPVL